MRSSMLAAVVVVVVVVDKDWRQLESRGGSVQSAAAQSRQNLNSTQHPADPPKKAM